MRQEFNLSTPKENFYNITQQVREAISASGVKNGIAIVFCPHTTAGITINENADPDVVHDMFCSAWRKPIQTARSFVTARGIVPPT